MYRRERFHSQQRENSYPQRRRTPSFSSSLLDAIYRSIDESNGGDDDDKQRRFQKGVNRKQRNYSCSYEGGGENEANLGRTIMIENWVEKRNNHRSRSHYNNSTSTSSDSSSSGCGGGGGGVFSSSEAESTYSSKKSWRSKQVSRSMKCMPFELQRNDVGETRNGSKQSKRENSAAAGGGGFTRTKLKALKIYGELKKAKQPISPGGRITNFLNSIFSSGNTKKVNVCSVKAMEDVNFESRNTTPSSSLKGKYNSNNNGSSNGVKRSVRFYPVSVIVDEDCRPCGQKSIYQDDYQSLTPLSNVQKIRKSCSLREEVKSSNNNYVRNYQKMSLSEFVSRSFEEEDADDDENDGDDDMSCSSSDLFELDHLIGIGRYREELPVYETTNIKTNQAIANGFLF